MLKEISSPLSKKYLFFSHILCIPAASGSFLQSNYEEILF